MTNENKKDEMKRMKFYQDGNQVKVKIGGKMYGTDIPLTFIKESTKEKEPFKVKKGMWVYLEESGKKIGIIYTTSDLNEFGSFNGFGYDYENDKWENSEDCFWFWSSKYAKREATEQEVVDMIEEQIETKGYQEGVRIKGLEGYHGCVIEKEELDISHLIEKGCVYLTTELELVCLMSNGEWAEIIEEENTATKGKYELTEKEITEVFKSWETNIRLNPEQHISNTGEIDIEEISKQYTNSFLNTLKSIKNEL